MKKKVDNAINLRKVMNKEFFTNQSNQIEECLDAVKKLNIIPQKRDFVKDVSRS